MYCEVAALSFQAHANYGTWSIDFDPIANFDNLFWKPVIRSFVDKCRFDILNIIVFLSGSVFK